MHTDIQEHNAYTCTGTEKTEVIVYTYYIKVNHQLSCDAMLYVLPLGATN